MEYKVEQKNNCFKCTTYEDDLELCICQINVAKGVWQISKWFTNLHVQHKGYGKTTLKYLVEYLIRNEGIPTEIDYIWNNVNQYVYDFIHTQFDAYCKVPIAVQKYMNDDSWEAHVYVLNIEKLMSYFKIRGYAEQK